MTYNVLNSNRDINAIAQVIKNSDADVVLIQEVREILARRIEPILASDYPYISLHPYPDVNSRLGLGVFSRYPLLVDDFDAYQPQSSRLRLQIDVQGNLVTIYDVHLINPLTGGDNAPEIHAQDIAALLDMLKDEQAPLIVAGDFNMTEISEDYGRMTENLVDSFRESGAGFGFTFPSWSPIPAVRLDYIFHSPDVRSLKTEVMPKSGGSDHFPVRTELTFASVSTPKSTISP